MVAVAQLVERRVVVSVVEGSNPFGHPFWRPPPRSRKPLSSKDLGRQSYFNSFVIFTGFLLTNVPIYSIMGLTNQLTCSSKGTIMINCEYCGNVSTSNQACTECGEPLVDNPSCWNEFDGQPDEAQEWHDFDPDC